MYFWAIIVCFFLSPLVCADDKLGVYNHYLNKMSSIEAEFVQISPDGDQQFGKFYLKKPGKMRWDYQSPKQFSIVINGNKLTHYDKQLDEASYGKSEEIAVHFLAKKEINLTKDMKVLSLDSATDGATHITLMPNVTSDKNKDYEKYKVRLVFKNKPLALQAVVMITPDGQYTRLNFIKLINDAKLDDKLFFIADPRLSRQTKIH
jgi:outer membrane lipoprotein-sorting protein